MQRRGARTWRDGRGGKAVFPLRFKTMALFWGEMNKKIDDGNFDVDDVIANTLFFENERMNRGRKEAGTNRE